MVAYSFQGRFIEPIRVGLSSVRLSFDCEPKTHTIRAVGKRRHARRGETLQLYHAQRSPKCFLIGLARCIAARRITMEMHHGRVNIIGNEDAGGEEYRGAKLLDQFARSDGFADWAELKEFWREEHGDLKRLGPFSGIIIDWEPIEWQVTRPT